MLLIKEEIFSIYKASRDCAFKTGQEKEQEDKILLTEYFTELITIARLIDGYPVEDEFLQGMRALKKTGKVPFLLVFTAQIFLEIHHTMRSRGRQSFESIMRETNFVHDELESHLDFHKSLKSPNWPASNDHGLQELRRIIKWVDKDPIYGAKPKVSAQRSTDCR